MHVNEIKIENFRNIDFMGIFPHKEINVIIEAPFKNITL